VNYYEREYKLNEVALLVVTCDKYNDLWHPYFKCFFKYWPDCPFPIYLGSNNLTYPDKRVIPITIGADIDYSSNLLRMLEKIDSEWVVLWVEDFLLSAPVDTLRMNNLILNAQAEGAGYVKLIASFPYAYTSEDFEVAVVPKGIKYRLNIGVTLFRKEVLVNLLKVGESAWDIEYKGAARSNLLPDKFFCLNSKYKSNPPISYINAVGKGKWVRSSIPFLKKEGLGEFLSSRKLQPWWHYFYYRLYLLRLDILCFLKIYWYDKK
jgi:hypothetical protein